MIVALIGETKFAGNPSLLIRIANALAGLMGSDFDEVVLAQ
jgi:hypothetical protein